jgi:hypothetical protein
LLSSKVLQNNPDTTPIFSSCSLTATRGVI